MAEGADVRLRSGPLRCPYCHDAIDLDGEWVACSRCLARHHDDCWNGSKMCGSCRGTSALVPAERAPPPRAEAKVTLSVSGLWDGKMDTGVGAARIQIELAQVGSEFTGYFFQGNRRGLVRMGRVSGMRVSFEVVSGDQEVWYEGRFVNDPNTIRGTWRSDADEEESGGFAVRRMRERRSGR